MSSELVLDLLEKGLSEIEIAASIGMSQPSVNRIKLRKQKGINYRAMDALRELHRRRCPEKYEAAA